MKSKVKKLLESVLKEVVTGENSYFDTDPSDGDADHDSSTALSADNYYDKGLKAFEDGDLEKAKEYYEQALRFGSWLSWTEREFPPYAPWFQYDKEE